MFHQHQHRNSFAPRFGVRERLDTCEFGICWNCMKQCRYQTINFPTHHGSESRGKRQRHSKDGQQRYCGCVLKTLSAPASMKLERTEQGEYERAISVHFWFLHRGVVVCCGRITNVCFGLHGIVIGTVRRNVHDGADSGIRMAITCLEKIRCRLAVASLFSLRLVRSMRHELSGKGQLPTFSFGHQLASVPHNTGALSSKLQ